MGNISKSNTKKDDHEPLISIVKITDDPTKKGMSDKTLSLKASKKHNTNVNNLPQSDHKHNELKLNNINDDKTYFIQYSKECNDIRNCEALNRLIKVLQKRGNTSNNVRYSQILTDYHHILEC
eukprot:118275_1